MRSRYNDGMSQALLIINGSVSVPHLRFLKNNVSYIACADGGANAAYEAGILPQVIIGDNDSIKPDVRVFFEQNHVEFNNFPVQKDKTDFELAINTLIYRFRTILLTGLSGTRLEMVLTNIIYLANTMLQHPDITFHVSEELFELYFIRDICTIRGIARDTISLFSVAGQVTGVDLDGLVYPLENGLIQPGSGLGISNQIIKEEVKIRIQSGILLAIHYKTTSQ